MWPERISGPESFIAEVAGDDDSFQVVCFNVIFYVPAMAFLSTHFANISQLDLSDGQFLIAMRCRCFLCNSDAMSMVFGHS